MSEGWLQIAREAVKLPGLLIKIYGDLARPGVRQVGKALETIIGLGNTILWPIALANERARISLQRNLEKFRARLEKIPEEKIVPVAPEVGVPIAERLAYVQDEKLSDLYVRLLSKASAVETVGQAHPSFVNVINNLSPDEAIILETFGRVKAIPFVVPRAVQGQRFLPLKELLVPKRVSDGLLYSQNMEAYWSNLAGLGLVVIRYDETFDDDKVYANLEAEWTDDLKAQIQQSDKLRGRALEFSHGLISVTYYGRQFIEACQKSES